MGISSLSTKNLIACVAIIVAISLSVINLLFQNDKLIHNFKEGDINQESIFIHRKT